MPVTTLEGRQCIAVGEGSLMSIVRAENVAGAPATWARRNHRGMIAGFPIPTRVQREDNAQIQSADIGCADVTTGLRDRQLFTPSLQNSIRHSTVARPL